MAVFAAAFVLLGLSNGYYLYFFLLPVAVVAGVELHGEPVALAGRGLSQFASRTA